MAEKEGLFLRMKKKIGIGLSWAKTKLSETLALEQKKSLRRRLIEITCFCLGTLLLLGVFVFGVNAAVCDKTRDRIVTAEKLAAMETEFDYVIVLGCKVHDDGRMSDRLADRVAVGITLYEAGIGRTLLMSGDRQEDGSYDEVGAMKQAALDAGVDEAAIQLDPKGYSTFESLVRLFELFQGKRVVIVTQEYHLYRALYIADKLDIEAWGVSADTRTYSDQVKCEVRELLARIKDVWYMQIKWGIDKGRIDDTIGLSDILS